LPQSIEVVGLNRGKSGNIARIRPKFAVNFPVPKRLAKIGHEEPDKLAPKEGGPERRARR
jgi:hypothetical protein